MIETICKDCGTRYRPGTDHVCTKRPVKKSAGALVSEPRKGRSKPGKSASRTVPQASHADNRLEVTGGGSDPIRATGGRHQEPALRTKVALGLVDEAVAQAKRRGRPISPNPKSKRAEYQRNLMRDKRAKDRIKQEKSNGDQDTGKDGA